MDYDYLSEICQLKQWKTIPNKELIREGFPVYGANGIVGYYSKYNHVSETILLGCRGTCGSVHISRPYSYINGNALCLDNLSNCYNMYYVYYFLKSLDYSKIISGTGIPQITQICLKNVTIPRFPLEKQIKISNELINIDELIKKNKLLLVKLDNIVKSQFIEMFGDCKNYKLIGDTLTICRGASPRPISKFITSDEDGINWIKIGDVDENSLYITSTKEKITNNGAEKSRRVKPGDFILSNSMSFGRPYILGINGCVHDGWLILSNYDKVFNPLYLYYAIRNDEVQYQFNGIANGATVRNLNSELVRNTNIKVPSIELQNQFASFVEQIDKSKYFGGVSYA
ncbi:MAG: restriction endonuclease subunit S [Coprobacillus sp.]|nr:restriction endonuclease subunit S [Coprobacillus sp.]